MARRRYREKIAAVQEEVVGDLAEGGGAGGKGYSLKVIVELACSPVALSWYISLVQL